MQWLPDHRKFIADSMALLNHGGVLAVQIPINYEEPIHKIINRITHNNKWNEKLPVKRKLYNLSQEEYFDILSGFSDNFEIWQTTYFHRMKSHNDIMEWYKGTGMRPYLELLTDDDKADFESDILAEIQKAYPIQKNGEIIFRFPRFFFIAVKLS